MSDKIVIDSNSKNAISTLRDTLCEYINPALSSGKHIILLCIGSDRSTGDSLGPLVGHNLKFLSRSNFHIFGNLESPVHAKNLNQVLKYINKKFDDPYIIAVDACLGHIQNIGKVFVENKPLKPGSAVNKDLPSIGNLSITGIVNISGALEFMVLQNTRLFTVMQLAELISNGIYHSVLKSIGGKKTSKNLK
ncbi:spore protease YyaC [Clostridium cochlearium]|uniref:Sporulation protein YyaC n=1 Tax=Clostridium cochlearium TaxID=1494 RepID=A0A240B465_CLOCO|nr:spore protease YyaC [Clostridium cochlearium]MBE6065644.1 spore protease YyaC [Clostridium cochlearium]MBU5270203.1 spore protease YyaC [Clostridium cochlearium]MCR1972107.1 spore protease YyaC [Clostridium cochlearium]MDU1443882.1 spore protease YyaC [Clostridium cochlearium]NOH16872.1 spore protease YyaC [Clostridium cochlearium]